MARPNDSVAARDGSVTVHVLGEDGRPERRARDGADPLSVARLGRADGREGMGNLFDDISCDEAGLAHGRGGKIAGEAM